jgi:shikimate kinase
MSNMDSNRPAKTLEQMIQEAVKAEIETVVAEEAEVAKRMVEKRVLKHMTFERYGQTLRIEVDFKGTSE